MPRKCHLLRSSPSLRFRHRADIVRGSRPAMGSRSRGTRRGRSSGKKEERVRFSGAVPKSRSDRWRDDRQRCDSRPPWRDNRHKGDRRSRGPPRHKDRSRSRDRRSHDRRRARSPAPTSSRSPTREPTPSDEEQRAPGAHSPAETRPITTQGQLRPLSGDITEDIGEGSRTNRVQEQLAGALQNGVWTAAPSTERGVSQSPVKVKEEHASEEFRFLPPPPPPPTRIMPAAAGCDWAAGSDLGWAAPHQPLMAQHQMPMPPPPAQPPANLRQEELTLRLAEDMLVSMVAWRRLLVVGLHRSEVVSVVLGQGA